MLPAAENSHGPLVDTVVELFLRRADLRQHVGDVGRGEVRLMIAAERGGFAATFRGLVVLAAALSLLGINKKPAACDRVMSAR